MDQAFSTFQWKDLHNPPESTLERVAQDYALNYFQVKDSLQPGHLPKIEIGPSYTFLILRAYTGEPQEHASTIEDLSNKIAFFYRADTVITVHRADFDFLEQVPQHIDSAEGLVLLLIHKILKSYDAPLHHLEEQIDSYEKHIFLSKGEAIMVSLEKLYYLKTHTRILKKLLQQCQTVVHQLKVDEANLSALQDTKDHLISLIHHYEEVLDNAQNLLNTFHSVSAQKNNDIMKMLTIFSAFFLPLTFIVGLYGMNFEHIPELKWVWGYAAVWGLMIAICLLIFYWFRKRRII